MQFKLCKGFFIQLFPNFGATMAGIYIHVPFCRQACHYCDFHFSTNLKTQTQMISAMVDELSLRSDYLKGPVETLYFGGGTPSLLPPDQIEALLLSVHEKFNLTVKPEITLEANPEDLTEEKLEQLKRLGINRLSIGFQTFDNDSLTWMNRIHTSEQATLAYQLARNAGFDNISLDLIYALPNLKRKQWLLDIEKAVALEPDHISVYGLTIESKTVFGHLQKRGELYELPEDDAAKQYLDLIQQLTQNGYEHYEVSNFCKPGVQSKHNSSYWKGAQYLGIGPGAHSFDGNSRQLNIRNNSKYIRAVNDQTAFFETEHLTAVQLLNERILTSLRTSSGISFDQIKIEYNVDLAVLKKQQIEGFVNFGLVNVTQSAMNLTPNGFLVADDIALQLFFDE